MFPHHLAHLNECIARLKSVRALVVASTRCHNITKLQTIIHRLRAIVARRV